MAKTVEAQKKRLQGLLGELEAIQEKHAGQVMPTDVATKFDELATEAGEMQDAIDAEMRRQEKFGSLKAWGGDDALEGGKAMPEVKTEPVRAERGQKFMELGEYITTRAEVQAYMEKGANGSVVVQLPGLWGVKGGPKGFVPVSNAEAKAYHQLMETKAVPTLGTGVIDADRLPGITYDPTMDDMLTVRDLLSKATTSSNQVEYVRRNSVTRAAAIQTEGSQKAEGTLAFDLQTAPVRTIAAWIPATTQQLADWPMLQSEISNFLLYDVRKAEEEQLVYGAGTGLNLTGLTVVAGTVDINTADARVTSPTILDSIRVGITEVRTNGYRPNGIAIHPIDWEAAVLLKATDDNYIWAVVQTQQGPRLWGLRVAESEGMEANAGNTTEERNVIVADWTRCATLVDRMQAQVMVGLDGNDFTSNKRTILAEERIAFPIRAPGAIGIFQSQAGVP